MNFKEAASKLKLRLKAGKDNVDLFIEGDKAGSQVFVVTIHRSNSLCLYYTRLDNKSYEILNYVEINLPSLMVSQEQVVRTKELSEKIADVIELFLYEDKQEIPASQIPIIALLESSKFSIANIAVDGRLSFNDAVKELQRKNDLEIFSSSPYIQEDTIFEFFTTQINRENPLNINIMYSSNKLLQSWSETYRLAGVKVAYLGPVSAPLLLELSESVSRPCILVDMQQRKSRIYCINGKIPPVLELPFPYGITHFSYNDAKLDIPALEKALLTTLVNNDSPAYYLQSEIYISGTEEILESNPLPGTKLSPAAKSLGNNSRRKIEYKLPNGLTAGSSLTTHSYLLGSKYICERITK